jgi:hypothetical protein
MEDALKTHVLAITGGLGRVNVGNHDLTPKSQTPGYFQEKTCPRSIRLEAGMTPVVKSSPIRREICDARVYSAKPCSLGGFTVPLVFSFRIRMRPGLIDIILTMAAKTTFPPLSKSA